MSVRGETRDRPPGGVSGRGAGAVLETRLGRSGGAETEERVQHLNRLGLLVGGRGTQFPRGRGRLRLARGGVLGRALRSRSLRPTTPAASAAASVELADGGLHDPEGLEGGGEGVTLFFLARAGDLVQDGREGLDAAEGGLWWEGRRRGEGGKAIILAFLRYEIILFKKRSLALVMCQNGTREGYSFTK